MSNETVTRDHKRVRKLALGRTKRREAALMGRTKRDDRRRIKEKYYARFVPSLCALDAARKRAHLEFNERSALAEDDACNERVVIVFVLR